MVKTELEIRFIFDVTNPLRPDERETLLDALAKVERLRVGRGGSAADVKQIAQTIEAMPVAVAEPVRKPRPRLSPAEETQAIRRALAETGSVDRAAMVLAVSSKTLYRRMKACGIPAPHARGVFTPW